MQQKRISLRSDQAEWLDDRSDLSMAPIVRRAIDAAMEEGRTEFPTGPRRDSDVVKTIVQIESDHQEYLADVEINFSAFVGEVLSQRMTLERKISELEGGA